MVGLEVMPIDGVTLSDGHGPEERTPTRRSARYLQSAPWLPSAHRTDCSAFVGTLRQGRRVLAGLCPAKLPLPQRSATLWSSSAAHGRLPV